MSAKSQRRLAAAIDLGAGAIRMDLAELDDSGGVRVLDSLVRPAALGRDVFLDREIGPGTTEACAGILRDFRQAADDYAAAAPLVIRAVATSAVREAENREAFRDRLFIATGIPVEPIEESEVHRLLFLALHRLLGDRPFMKRGDALVVEVGGGGTRVLTLQDGIVTGSETFRLGALRVRETLDPEGDADRQAVAAVRRQIDRLIDQVRRSVPIRRAPHLVAVTGDLSEALIRALWPDAEAGRPTLARALDAPAFLRASRVIERVS